MKKNILVFSLILNLALLYVSGKNYETYEKEIDNLNNYINTYCDIDYVESLEKTIRKQNGFIKQYEIEFKKINNELSPKKNGNWNF